MVPTSWNGSIMIYERIIRPFILKHKDAIDKRLNQAADVASDLMNEGQYWSLLVYVVLVPHLVKSFHIQTMPCSPILMKG